MNIMNKVKCISLLLFIVGGIHCGKLGEIENLLIQLTPEKLNVTSEEFNDELKLRSEKHLKMMKPFFSEEEIQNATDAAEEYLRAQFDLNNILIECDSLDNCDSKELIKYYTWILVGNSMMQRANVLLQEAAEIEKEYEVKNNSEILKMVQNAYVVMQNANELLQEAADIEKEYEVKNNLEILKRFHHAAQKCSKYESKIKLICKKLSESKNYEAFMKKVEAHQQKNQ